MSISPREEILARMYVMMTLFALVPLAVAVQVVRVGWLQADELRVEGRAQADRQVEIPAMRGTILDRTGRTLAVNTVAYDIAVDPTASGFAASSSDLYDTLSRVTGQARSVFTRRVAQRSSPQFALLARGLSESARLDLAQLDVPGLRVTQRENRRYAYGPAASHLIGHVDTDLKGRAGIEAVYNDYLQGTDGSLDAVRDRHGFRRVATDGQVTEPKHGQTLVLTVDLLRQTVMEEALARGVAAAGARWGTAIAMDPRTGAIIGMANVPTYDPNSPGSYSTFARRNHAVTDRLEPGSTFKLVTAIAALETGTVGMDEIVETGPGWMVLHGRTLKDTHAHGSIPFREVLAQSSNIGAALVAERLPAGALYKYSRQLGFGMPTWVDLPGEVSGTLKRPSRWSRSTASAMSRGYEVEATPLQVLTAYAALANGGLVVRPHVVAERRDVTGNVVWTAPTDSVRRAFDVSTAQALLPAFETAVNAGTAERAQVQGLRIAGKTGTAMKAAGGTYTEGAYRASFVGLFPAEAPSVVLLVLMDEPQSSIYGGSVAAPVFQEIAERWLPTLDQETPATRPELRDVPSPTLAHLPIRVARRTALSYAVDLRIRGAEDGTIVEQDPPADTPLERGQRVRARAAVDSTGVATTNFSSRDALFLKLSAGTD